VRDREALLELWQAVGTGAALLAVAWAAIELVIGVDLLGILAFAVLASIAIAAVVMIFVIQSGSFPAYRGRKTRPAGKPSSRTKKRPKEIVKGR
jgi:hypothetical protein